MPFDPRVHLGVALLMDDPDTHRLLLMRRKGAHGWGQWSVPGGWVDYGEHPWEAAMRELVEETGIAAWTIDLVGSSSHTFDSPVDTSVTLFYHVTRTKQYMGNARIMEPDKADDLAWVLYDELKNYDLFPPLAKFLEAPMDTDSNVITRFRW